MNRYIAQGIARDLKKGRRVIYVNLEGAHAEVVRTVRAELDNLDAGSTATATRIEAFSGGRFATYLPDSSSLEGVHFDVAVVRFTVLLGERGVFDTLRVASLKSKGGRAEIIFE